MITLNAPRTKYHVILDTDIPKGLSALAESVWLYVYIHGSCSEEIPESIINELIEAGVMTEAHEIIIGDRKPKKKTKSVPMSEIKKQQIADYGEKQTEALHECTDEIVAMDKSKRVKLIEFLKYRKEKKKPLSALSIKALIKEFEKREYAEIVMQMKKTITTGWTGLFFEDQKSQNGESHRVVNIK